MIGTTYVTEAGSLLGPITLEQLCLIWKYGGYTTDARQIATYDQLGIDLGNQIRLYLRPPKDN